MNFKQRILNKLVLKEKKNITKEETNWLEKNLIIAVIR